MGREQTIELNGNKYCSVKSACDANNLSITSIYEYRRKNHCTTEEALVAVFNKSLMPAEKYKAFGKEFDNIAQACREFKVSGDIVRTCIRDLGMNLEDAITETRKRMNFTERCIRHGINPYVARNFIRVNKCTQDEAIEGLCLAAKSDK